jgi:HAE1 family hydrophobic/amphiphilic exporter-1
MSIAELSVRRHVLALMASVSIVLFGWIALGRIGVDRYPPIEFPIISVTTVLPGANPDIVDASITGIIESAVNAIPGIDFLQSTSSPGVSTVIITFELDRDIDAAFTEVQARVNQVLRLLPRDAETPVVQKVEFGVAPVVWLSLSGDRSLKELNRYARNIIKKRLETIDGVGQVIIGGERRRTIRVELDPAAMFALGVSVSDLREAFAREHVSFPGGFLVDGDRERLIKLDLEFHSAEALAEMPIRHREGATIRLKDFATVIDGLADLRQIARFNGRPTVGIGVVKIANANTVAVVEAVRERIEREIRPQLPAGMQIEYAVDEAGPIREIVRALYEHLIEGTLLAALVVFLFLRDLRSTLIIAISIPVSLLGAIAALYFGGYTFNTMTLLALLLLIGVVVDDSIVVLENVFHKLEGGERDREHAAIRGTEEVFFAVSAASLTLVSIFAAVLFLGGIIGRFFESFAVVVTVGVLVSWFVSLTLTPMLASRVLRLPERHGRLYLALERGFAATEALYRRLLDWGLGHRGKVVLLTLLALGSAVPMFAIIPKEFASPPDDGRFVINFRTPLGTSIEASSRALDRIEAELRRIPEVQGYFSAIGLGSVGQVSRGIVFVTLSPREARHRSQNEVIEEVRERLSGLPGVLGFVSPPSVVAGQRGEPLQFALVGPELSGVGAQAAALRKRLAAEPGFERLDLDLQLELPQLDFVFDRARAAELGVSAADLAFAVNLLAGGVDIAKFNDDPGDGERYEIRAKAREGTMSNPSELGFILLRGRDGEFVRLDALARPREILGPAVIQRFELRYAALFYVNPSVPLEVAVERLFAIAAETLPPGYEVRLIGQAREFQATAAYVQFAFLLALALVYIVLSSQFNSLRQPLVVMLAQPLAVIGGLALLLLTGTSLNIFSMIGMVLLVGLVAKNSILLIDLTNQLRAQGLSVDEALRSACPRRLRPVLMTSVTVILALLPAAIGAGAGADVNAPLAIAVIGGMVSSTLLTLVVVPAVYSLVEGALERRFRRAGRGSG